jgi:phage-related tail protein
MGAWRKAISAALMLSGVVGVADAQTMRASDEVRACACKDQLVSTLNGDVLSQSRAYEAKRQAFEALDKQVQTSRPQVNVRNQAEIDSFKQLLARRDAAADALADAANQSYADTVQRYNEAVSDYNASCADKAFDPEQMAELKRTLSCAKP